jgi:hypothetical protein
VLDSLAKAHVARAKGEAEIVVVKRNEGHGEIQVAGSYEPLQCFEARIAIARFPSGHG